MKTNYYGWVNTKINRMMGATHGGEWREVSCLKYWWLKINGFIVKKDKVAL